MPSTKKSLSPALTLVTLLSLLVPTISYAQKDTNSKTRHLEPSVTPKVQRFDPAPRKAPVGQGVGEEPCVNYDQSTGLLYDKGRSCDAQIYHCPSGSKWVGEMATTSYVINSGCYTKEESDRAWNEFFASLCNESSFMMCGLSSPGKWECTGRSSRLERGYCITEEILPNYSLDKPRLSIPQELQLGDEIHK